MNKAKMIYNRKHSVILNGKWVYNYEQIEVKVMCVAENYAMVRRKGCMPFVVSVKDLTPPTINASPEHEEQDDTIII